MSTTALARTNGAAVEFSSSSKYDDPGILKTIQETVCKGANESQFRMFIEICRTTGLNPFLKEIWFVQGVGIMAARDGYLRVANDHPMFDGMETRVERDSQMIPIKAVCTVWRKDRSHPIICEAYYNEYKKTSSVWTTYKSAMISKVAEVLALKRSFAINGVVTEEEIGTQQAQLEAEPRGSKEAAQAVAQEKLAQMRKAEKQRKAITVEPERTLDPEPEAPTDLERQLEASVKQSQTTKNFSMLEGFQNIKKEIGDAEYYRILAENGYEKSNQITDLKDGRRIYKEMGARLAEIRDEKAQAEEAALGV